MKKTVLILLILVTLITACATVTYAEFQVGIALQSQTNQPVSGAIQLDDRLAKEWGIRGSYNPSAQVLSGDVLYQPKRNSAVAPYFGVGIRDDMGGSSSGVKLELVGGVELNSSKVLPNTSISMEMSGVPNDLGHSATFSISINYRFPDDWFSKRSASNPSDDQVLLAKLITAEADEEPYEGQVAVGAVVINRTKTPLFPQTIKGTVYEPGQFQCASKLRFLKPSENALKAAKEALDGHDPSNGALYFYNPATSSPQGLRFFSRLKVTARIGNHVFAK